MNHCESKVIHDSQVIHTPESPFSFYFSYIYIYMIHIYLSSRAREKFKGQTMYHQTDSWKDKKNTICNLIKQISDYYGGDDIAWLREYAQHIIEQNKDNLDEALLCFLNISIHMKHTCYGKDAQHGKANLL